MLAVRALTGREVDPDMHAASISLDGSAAIWCAVSLLPVCYRIAARSLALDVPLKTSGAAWRRKPGSWAAA